MVLWYTFGVSYHRPSPLFVVRNVVHSMTRRYLAPCPSDLPVRSPERIGEG